MTASLRILIIDTSLARASETVLRLTAAPAGTLVFELTSNGDALAQIENILTDHPDATDVTIVGHTLRASSLILLGGNLYFDRLDMNEELLSLANDFPDMYFTARGLGNLEQMHITGTPANDLLIGRSQDDLVDGLAGIDTFKLTGTAAAHDIDAKGTSFQVRSWADGIDFLSNIERLKFSDYNVALDISGNGHTGTALRFLTALMGAEAIHDKDLMGIAISYADRLSPAALADTLIDSGVVAQFAGGHSDKQLVSMLYTNITGVAPSTADVTHYVDYMESHHMNQAQLLQWVTEMPETANRIDLVGLAQHGIGYFDQTV